jgi:hypothetical protein
MSKIVEDDDLWLDCWMQEDIAEPEPIPICSATLSQVFGFSDGGKVAIVSPFTR